MIYIKIEQINSKITNKIIELNYNIYNDIETKTVIKELKTLETYKKELLREYHLK